jgi:hypothetical protein
MAINPDYLVAGLDLSEVFLDKDTGQPLSGGTISFFRDVDHVTPKLVYTIQNNNPALPPAYSYVPLPDPITLSASGQIQDNNGNNVPVYYYPFNDTTQLLDLYYIVVANSQGVQQFTRQGWPPNESQILPPPGGQFAFSNQITNSQFVDVNFPPTIGISFNYVGVAVNTINIAPGWNLVISSTGNGTVTVVRTPIAGSLAYPNNPPYTLTITPGANLASLQLVQTFSNNPDVFSPALAAGGYLSASILLAPASQVIIGYQPNGQAVQLVLNANNTGGAYATFNNTVQLAPATNPSTGDTGSVNIILGLSITVPTTLSNIQIVPLNTNIAGITYDQRTANRERDFEFNYYGPLLKAKPIPSYLIGWEFPLNPAQALGWTLGPYATGANGSFQAIDQTIIFQSVTNGVTTTQSATGTGALRITANAATQFAIIQYIPSFLANEILNNPLSSMFSGTTNFAGTLVGTISLWYTAGALPHTGIAPAGPWNSLVTGLSATGYPTVAGGWTEVTRNGLGNAQFTLGQSANLNWLDYGFSGWNANGVAGVGTATYFAIVVGFATLGLANSIDIGAVSLVPGNIPTRPGAKTDTEVFEECKYFYQSTFNYGVVPAQAVGNFSGDYLFTAISNGAQGNYAPTIYFVPSMYAAPTITFYNPHNMNGQPYDYTAGDCSAVNTRYILPKGFALYCTGNAGGTITDTIGVHWSADARLGV